MRSLIKQLFATVALYSGVAWSHDLTGEWVLEIQGPSHQVEASLVVKFTNEHGSSCMAGDWMRVVVVSAIAKNPQFFPVSEPLSYEVRDGHLTIGRNQICDAYLMLRGELNDGEIRGKYFSLGLGGSTPLGTFTLSQKK
jgi:hypothetical protein